MKDNMELELRFLFKGPGKAEVTIIHQHSLPKDGLFQDNKAKEEIPNFGCTYSIAVLVEILQITVEN